MRRRTRGLRVLPQGPAVAPGEVAAGVAGAGSGDLQLQQPLRVEADDRLELGVDGADLHTMAAAVTRGAAAAATSGHTGLVWSPHQSAAGWLESAGMHAIMHALMKRGYVQGHST